MVSCKQVLVDCWPCQCTPEPLLSSKTLQKQFLQMIIRIKKIYHGRSISDQGDEPVLSFKKTILEDKMVRSSVHVKNRPLRR
jgi:hypothetical protein